MSAKLHWSVVWPRAVVARETELCNDGEGSGKTDTDIEDDTGVAEVLVRATAGVLVRDVAGVLIIETPRVLVTVTSAILL